MLPVFAEAVGSFEVVYNLTEVSEGLFLPNAYIVSKDREGLLAHIKQRATVETIGSFQLELTDTRRRIFKLIDELQPKQLEKRFSPPKRRVKPLEDLLKDEEIAKTITLYVHRRLDEILQLIARHQFPLTWEVDRRVLVKDFLVDVTGGELEAQLSFKRHAEGVSYRLRLKDGRKTWKISERDVVPVTNHPAWLVIDYRLFHVAHINGNLVKPFRQRDEVNIPAASVKTYFQKFILKIAAKVDIDADGFAIDQVEDLQGCRLEVTHSLLGNERVLAVQMQYPHTDFGWRDRKDKRTTLEFNGEEVRILQVRRNFGEEAKYIDRLKAFGVVNPAETPHFQLPEVDTSNPWQLEQWLAEQRPALEEAGFTIGTVHHLDQEIYLRPAQLLLRSEQSNDWFDILGQVTVGEFTFPFLKLARYIRDENRFFPLPNGTYFLIPQEWLTKYKGLAQFARKEGDHLRLNRSQFTLLQELGFAQDTSVTDNLEEVDFQLSSRLQAQLRPYQLEGVKWLVQLYRNQLGACLADDMGLGKTLQTIAALLHAKENKVNPEATVATAQKPQLDLFAAPADDESFLLPLNALIILPASLVFNWESELRKFAPHLQVYLHTGSRRHRDMRLLRRFDVILTTYQTALRDVDLLAELEYEYIILDESQQIKNRESKVFRAINELNGRHKISLSGTPIENSLSDLWSQMQFINPDLLGGFSFFKKEFITPIEKRQDEEKKARLRTLVAPYLLRRTKEEVARDLPPLTTQTFYSEMTPEQKRLYEREKSAVRNYLLENFDANDPQYRMLMLRSLTKLRQLVNHPRLVSPQYQRESGKYNDIMEQWEVIRRSDHKVLMFSSFVQYLDIFKTDFEQRQQPYAWLTGDLTAKARQREINRFEQEKEVQSFLISIKSGGTGLNLTAADYVFILDPWWNPTTEQQAIARAHRIGQDKNVIAIKFITKDSIEEKILKLQERKSRLAEDIIDNVQKASFTKGDIEYLLE
ncbi:MAG: ATP-dependent helicase [Lewinellaceae bacterium]|nr:ATP-dependent helicase [Lewinellaceae bacterium]